MNAIKIWSRDKPTVEGDYFVCFGDVETPENIFYLRLKYDETGSIVDQDGDDLDGYNDSYKWAAIDFSG